MTDVPAPSGHDRVSFVRLGASALLMGSCPALRWVFSRHAARLFPAYRRLSKALMGALAAVMGVAPVAVWDIAALVLVVAALTSLVRRIRRRDSLLPWFSTVCLVGSVTLALFVDGWALNHYAPPLAQELDLEVREYTVDELAAATEYYLAEAASQATGVPRNPDGSLARQGFFELARKAGSSYAELGERYEVLAGSEAPVKALLVWGEPLLWSGHTGIFWAPTGESGVPLNSAVADEPYIMCHEAAHRLGLASEQEANFAAYLACEASDDVRFGYSGSFNAFSYCFNALYRHDPDAAVELLERVAASEEGEGVALVWQDRLATHEHYSAYDGPFEKVGSTVNDSYLKSFGETSGVQSYGLVVDYLIAWQQAR